MRTFLMAIVMLFAFTFTATAKQITVGFIYVGPIGDHGWTYRHDIGRQDVQKHFGDKVKTVYLENVKYGPDAERAIRGMAEYGADIIFATSFGYMEPMLKVAKEFPNVKFEHATGYKQSKNMASYGLRLYQARHVQGIIAGMMTKTNKIGVVGALDIPFLHRYTDPYADGAKAVNPNVEVETRWVGGDNPFGDPVRAKEQALAMYSAGSDIIFTATAGGDFGVFEGAQENNFRVLSVDVNRCENAPGYIIDNTLKGVDAAILNSVEVIKNGAEASFTAVGLKEGGMGLMALKPDMLAESQCLIAEQKEVLDEVRKAAEEIMNGSLEIKDPMFAN